MEGGQVSGDARRPRPRRRSRRGRRRSVRAPTPRSRRAGRRTAALPRSHHGADRDARERHLAVALEDPPVLGAVEVEDEDDPVGAVDELAAGADEQGAGGAAGRPMAHEDLVAFPLEERAVELGPLTRAHIDEDRRFFRLHAVTVPPSRRTSGRAGGHRVGGRRHATGTHTSVNAVTSMSPFSRGTSTASMSAALVVPLVVDGDERIGEVGFEVGEGLDLVLHAVLGRVDPLGGLGRPASPRRRAAERRGRACGRRAGRRGRRRASSPRRPTHLLGAAASTAPPRPARRGRGPRRWHPGRGRCGRRTSLAARPRPCRLRPWPLRHSGRRTALPSRPGREAELELRLRCIVTLAGPPEMGRHRLGGVGEEGLLARGGGAVERRAGEHVGRAGRRARGEVPFVVVDEGGGSGVDDRLRAGRGRPPIPRCGGSRRRRRRTAATPAPRGPARTACSSVTRRSMRPTAPTAPSQATAMPSATRGATATESSAPRRRRDRRRPPAPARRASWPP